MRTVHVKQMEHAPKGLVLDVRTPAEHEEVHVPEIILQPLSELLPEKVSKMAEGRPVYLLCRSGNRARQAFEKLSAAGLRDIAVVEGGVQAWEAAGLPVVRGKKTISLERQVRIGAGLLVLTGVALGFAVHTAFFAISALVGAGLVFAGVTDWCGMGMLLAKMPWNQHRAHSCNSGAACRS